jgi:Tol biopolymer transport system component
VELVEAEGRITDVKVSPDGALVAYTVELPDGTTPLWVVNADGSDARPLVAREQLPPPDPNRIDTVHLFEWQPESHTIFFNTRYVELPGPVGPGERVNADLWLVDADSGNVRNVLGRQSAGRFVLSPDGEHIALVLPQAIEMMDAAATEKRTLLEFPMILTYSEYIYYPQVTWSPDSSFFSVAVPSRDPMAADASVTFYRMSVGGEAEELGTVAGNFLTGGALHFSPDGEALAAVRINPSGPGQQLLLINADGSEEQVIDEKPLLNGLGWSPDSQHYAYSRAPEEGGAFVADREGNLEPFAPDVQAVTLEWMDETVVVFYGVSGNQWGLYAGSIMDPPQQIAEGAQHDSIVFDVRPVTP